VSNAKPGGEYIGAIDQGTTSTRFILFDRKGNPVASSQMEHRQIYPRPGWVEHDPCEIWDRTRDVVSNTLRTTGVSPRSIAAIGITNQRETTILWNRKTGKPGCNAIVWQDTRTAGLVESLAADGGTDRFRKATGLPLATYFSGPKIAWILDSISGVREAALTGDILFGTIDSWLIWNLTGGPSGGVHVTDATNASRTQLLDLSDISWDEEILSILGIPRRILPRIVPSSTTEPYGVTAADTPFGSGIPITGDLGDQQAALYGQACFDRGSSKNTYGTGCFLLLNTGEEPVLSRHGLITTVACLSSGEKPRYALEGSIAVAGALVQWLRDNLGLIASSSEIERLARTVPDSGGVYIVPAFSGLFAPHWRSDARGIIAGLTGYANRGHIARAVLEATAFQTWEIVEAMEKDSGIEIPFLKVDGGMVVDELLMQFQADILDIPVIRPRVIETTALGAAYAAGHGIGFWTTAEISSHWAEDRRWLPSMEERERQVRRGEWNKAVSRTLGWL